MKTNIINFLDFEKIDTLLEGFNKTTGFVTAILDLDGNILSKSGWRSICTEFHRKHPQTAKRCIISDTELANEIAVDEKYHFYKCLNGLIDVAVPLVINGEHIANLFSGQFFFEEADRGSFLSQAEKFGFDNEKYMKALEEVPVFSEDRVKQAMEFLLGMTAMIAEMTMHRIDLVNLNDEIKKNQLQLKAQNEELMKAKEKAEESEKYLNSILNSMGDPIFVKDDQSRILMANEAFCSLFKLSINQIIGKTLAGDVSDEERKSFLEIDRQVLATGQESINEETLTLNEGKARTISTRKTRFIDKNGRKYIVGAIRDITGRKQSEIELRASEEKFRSYIKHAPNGVFISDENGHYTEVNAAACRITGYTEDELLKLSIMDMLPPEEIEKGVQHFNRVNAEGVARDEIGFVTKNGEKRFWNVAAVKLSNTKYLGFVQDTTERKRAEDEIKQSQNLSKTIIDSIPGTFYMIDATGKYIGWNAYQRDEIAGQTENQMGNISAIDTIHPEDRPIVEAKITNVLKEGVDEVVEARVLLRGGPEYRWFLMTGRRIIVKGNPVLVGIGIDVTENKQAEQKLKESETRYKALHNASFGGITIHDKGIILECNRGLTEITGYTYDELIGMDGLLLIAESSRKMVMNKIISGYEKPYEALGLRKNGEEYPIRLEGRNIPYKGKTARTVEFRDITEQKLAEETLKKSEEKLRTIINISPDGITIASLDGKIEFVSGKILQMLGFSAEEMLNKNMFDFVDSAYHSMAQFRIGEMLNNRYTGPAEYELIRKNGTRIYVEINSEFVRDKDGNPASLFFVQRDITERKNSESAQRESEAKQRHLLQNLHAGVVVHDADSSILFANDRASQLLGLSYDQMMGKTAIDPAWHFVREDMTPMPVDQYPVQHVIATKTPLREHLMGIHHPKTNQVVWVLINAFPEFEPDGSLLQVVVTFIDITERKEAEEMLKAEALERQRTERELRRIEWQLTSRTLLKEDLYVPPYGDLVPLNSTGLIRNTVGVTMLTDIVGDYLDLLDTSAAVYEKNGDYALGIFSSGWCRFMDAASRRLCGTTDNNEALACGKWLCHESCWTKTSKTAIKTGQPADIECEGGLHIYSVPVCAGLEIVGAINFGYGDPPTDEVTLNKLAARYDVNVEELRTYAAIYESRPPFIINLAKKRLRASARLIGEIIERKQAEEALRKREALLNKIFDVLPVGLWLADKNGNLTRSNAKGREIWGAEQLVGQEQYGVFKARFLPSGKELGPNDWALAHTIQEGITIMDELLEIDAFDGRKKIILNCTAPIHDQSGKIDGAIIVNMDITALKHAEEALQISKNRFDLAMAASKDGIFDWNLLTNEIYYSPGWVNMLGYQDNELPNDFSVWETLTAPDDVMTSWKMQQEMINKQRDRFEIEFKMKHKAGHWVDILSRAEAVFDDSGQAVRIVGTHVDITDRKRTEILLREKTEEIEVQNEELTKSNDEYAALNEEYITQNEELISAKEKAEESDRLKSAFLANMSHEIRTPMNGILGFAELLKEPNLSGEELHRYISIIEKSGIRMLNIINDIICISKIEAGLMEVNWQDSNINEQTEYIYTFFKPEVEGKGMQFSLRNSLPSKMANLITDREKVYAILTNLVKNAIKYSVEGSIGFGYVKKGDCLEFFVKDTGIGIPSERQQAIFERFVQADIADKNAYQGAGLGLSISKAYVAMLGGTIWVESEVGVGSCFYFTIPYRTKMTGTNITTIDRLPLVEPTPQSRLKILVAEDDPTSEELISITIRPFAREVLCVRSGTEAVEACLNNPDINLILMDILLPGLNGYEATRQIRHFNKDVVIIAQTAYALEGDRNKALDAGCNDYIAKPIKKTELINLINKYI